MCGYDIESFWDQTPRTLSFAFEAQKEIRQTAFNLQHNQNAWLAWHVAALQRSKRMPPLHKLMVKQKQTTTLEDQLEGLKHWVQATGGQVIYKQ